MSKKFTKITMAKSNEVSLCPTFNSGANKQTEFEIVKDHSGAVEEAVPVLEGIKKYSDFYCYCCDVELEDAEQAFIHYLNDWAENRMNDAIYWLLKDSLDEAMSQIKWSELSKEEKTKEYAKLFNAFVNKFKEMPITKTQDGKYEVSLVSKSHNQEQDTVPQNETADITKEKKGEMEEQEKNPVLKALDVIKTAVLGLAKTETPAEEPSEETLVENAEGETSEIVEDDKPEEKPAEEETPVVKSEEVEVEKSEEEKPEDEEKVEDAKEEAEEPKEEAVEKASDFKAEEEKDEEIDDAEDVAEDLAEAEAKKKLEAEAKKKAEEEMKKTSENPELAEIIKQKADLEAELESLKKSQAEKEIEIEKMSYLQKAKDEYSMLAGTPEEIGEKLYSIAKSNLDDASKEFILESLKKVSKQNKEMTEEVGSITKNADDMTEEDRKYQQAEELAKSKGISVNKALRLLTK